jgi:enolase-phosphatase E1
MIRAVLLDIEGTTTDIAFVHEVLFPYARKHLAGFVAAEGDVPAVEECLARVAATVWSEEHRRRDRQGLIETLEGWIETDRKHPALKELQGMIWRAGYENNAYTAHLYEDVLPVLKEWRAAGLQVAIYSSGSVAAQQLLFSHTVAGDVTPLLKAYFDLEVGNKREASSYEAIARELRVPPCELLFVSDVCEELDAAAGAGLQTVQMVRPGTEACGRHRAAASFREIGI